MYYILVLSQRLTLHHATDDPPYLGDPSLALLCRYLSVSVCLSSVGCLSIIYAVRSGNSDG